MQGARQIWKKRDCVRSSEMVVAVLSNSQGIAIQGRGDPGRLRHRATVPGELG